MERSRDGAAQPAAILRYVYPGVTPKNGRVVTIERDGGGRGEPVVLDGGDIASALESDGVDLTRWRLRYYHKAHEGWMLLRATTEVEFHPSNRILLELALEPPQSPSDESESKAHASRDGYHGIGIVGGKTETNHGTLWRSAWQLGAAFIFSVGARFEKSSADTTKAWTSLPAYEYSDWNASPRHSRIPPRGSPWRWAASRWKSSNTRTEPYMCSGARITVSRARFCERARITCRYRSAPRDARRATTSPLRGRSCCSIDSRRGAGGGTEERKTRVSPEGARGWTA